MGHSQDEKQRSHDRIVEIAARRIREAGTGGPGVAEIMREAGLTHGGFYKHFPSRDALVVEAVEQAFAEGSRNTAEVISEAEDPLRAFADWYASAAHCDDPGTGCGVVAFGADAARADPEIRAAYTGQVRRYLAELQRLIGGEDAQAARRARVALSTLVGAVLVARAVDDPELSQALLADARDAVVSP